MKYKIINKFSNLKAYEREWKYFQNRINANSIFLSPSWLLSWWQAYSKEKELNVILLFSDIAELVAIVPLVLYTEKQLGGSYNILSFLGDGTFETDHMDFLIRPEFQEEATQEIFSYIFSFKEWDIVKLNMIPEQSENHNSLDIWLNENKIFHTVEKASCPFAELPDSFEEYIKTRKPRVRNKIRSTAKKLEKKYNIEFGLHSKAEKESALELLFELHTKRWESVGQTGDFKLKERRDFYYLLSEELFNNGWMRFFYLKLNGNIVAQQYCILYNNTIYLLQEGFDPVYAKEDIGNYLRARVFQYCINQNIKIYDFLAGDSRHKRNWSTDIVYDLRYTIYNNTLKSKSYYYIPKIVEAVKSPIRKMMSDKMLIRLKTGINLIKKV